MTKTIYNVVSQSTTQPIEISSTWAHRDDYNGIRLSVSSNAVLLVAVGGTYDNTTNDALYYETYRVLPNEDDTFVMARNIELDATYPYYKIIVKCENQGIRIDVRAEFFNKTGKSNKTISYIGTYDVKEFSQLKLKIWNNLVSTPAQQQLKITPYSSVGKSKNQDEIILSIKKSIFDNYPQSLTQYNDVGGYFFASNPHYDYDGDISDYNAHYDSVGNALNPEILEGVNIVNLEAINAVNQENKLILKTFLPVVNFDDAYVDYIKSSPTSLSLVENDVLTDYLNAFDLNTNKTIVFTLIPGQGYSLNNNSSIFRIYDGQDNVIYVDINENVLHCTGTIAGGVIEGGIIEGLDLSEQEIQENGLDKIYSRSYNIDMSNPISVAIQTENIGTAENPQIKLNFCINGVLDTPVITNSLFPTTNIEKYVLSAFMGKLIHVGLFDNIVTEQDLLHLHDFASNALENGKKSDSHTIDLSGISHISLEKVDNDPNVNVVIEGLLF